MNLTTNKYFNVEGELFTPRERYVYTFCNSRPLTFGHWVNSVC